MERKFYTDDFEELLKEKADEFRMYPSKRVWHSIYNDLHPGRKWPSVAVSLILIIALLIVGYWNNQPSVTSAIAKNSSAVQPEKQLIASTSANNNISSNAVSPVVNTAAGTNAGIAASTSVNTNSNANSGVAVTASTVPANQYINNQNSIAGNSTAAIAAHQKNIAANTISAGNNINQTGKTNNVNNNKQQVVAGTNFTKISSSSATQVSDEANGKQRTNNIATAKATTDGWLGGNGQSIADGKTTTEETVDAATAVQMNAPAPASIQNLSANNNPASATNSLQSTSLKENDKTVTKPAVASNSSLKEKTNRLLTAEEDKMWIDNYAFYNKSKRKKWQDRTSIVYYITPSIGFRHLSNEAKYNLPASSPSAASTTAIAGIDARNAVTQKPGPGFEAGITLQYKLAKKLIVKAGLQANYTNYAVYANELNHPVLTTLMLLDPNSGYPTMYSANSTLSNIPGVQASSIVHNQTYQVSLPIGAAFKMLSTKQLEWYAGATIQPTYVLGGKAFLISADRGYYVSDPSLIRRWNMNAGIETYISYKLDNFTLLAGPQLRYQTMSTYYKKYTVNENLYNVGIKIGIVKNL